MEVIYYTALRDNTKWSCNQIMYVYFDVHCIVHHRIEIKIHGLIKGPLDIVPKCCVVNNLYFKTACHIRPHFLGPMGGLVQTLQLLYVTVKKNPGFRFWDVILLNLDIPYPTDGQ